jgi:hypothetical protein
LNGRRGEFSEALTFPEEQIAFVVKQSEAATPIAEV